MAHITLNLTPDCRLLTYTLQGINSEILEEEGGDDVDAALDEAAIEVYNNGSLITSFTRPLFSTVDTGSYINTFTAVVATLLGEVEPGIITFIMQDPSGNRGSAAILISCELDCCLADKVLDLTKCEDCDSKCNEKLALSQKIFLYMESIRTMLSQLGDDVAMNEGIISQSIDTYTAAKELCAGSCGCNC